MPIPRVGNSDYCFSILSSHSQFYSAAALAVFGRVGQQVRKHLSQSFKVAIDEEVLGAQLHHECVALRADCSLAGLGANAQYFTHSHLLVPQVDLAGADATYIQEIIDEVDEMTQLSIHDLDGALKDRAWLGVSSSDLQAVTQWRERVPQFMRERCEKFVLSMIALTKRLFIASAGRHVACRTEPLDDLSIIIQQRHGTRERPAKGAIDALYAVLKLKQALCAQRLCDGGGYLRPIVRVDVFVQPIPAGDGCVANDALAIELPHLRPIGTHAVDHVRSCRHQRPKAFFSGAESSCGALQVREGVLQRYP